MSETKVIDAAGDDLDDGLQYEVEFTSDNEGNAVSDGEIADLQDLVQASEEAASEPVQENPKKRKNKSSFQEKKRMKMELDMKKKKDLSLEESPEVIADYLNDKIRRTFPDLSALELTEKYFTKAELRSTADFTETRNLDNLPTFIETKFKNMLPSKKNKKMSENDKKFIAIVSMSAIRACDTHRATKELGGSSLKLINKNKLQADLKIVGTTHSRVLCCTPGRLTKILNNEDLQLKKEQLKIIIVDNSYLDSKQQNIWDIQESTELLKDLTKSGSKLYLY